MLNRENLHLEDLPSHDCPPWTLGDVGELIRRVGVAAEFKVVPEFPLGKQRRIDWVWMHAETDALLAGFEIEGANVPRRSVRNDIRRFIKARCRRNYIVTYGRRFNREKKDLVDLGDWNDRVQQLIDRQANTVKITLLRHSEPDMPEAVMSIARRMLSRPKQAKSSRR